MNNLDKAQRSEALFSVYCAEKGIELAKPLFHSAPYDFVIRMDGEWETVQVKTAFPAKNGNGGASIVVELRRAGNGKTKIPYLKGDYDYLFCVFGNRKWFMPESACSHIRSTLNLGQKVAKYEI